MASPPRLVVSGFYRYVRNPIYVGFLAILTGQVLLFGSSGLLEYTALSWCIGAAAVRFYEEPVLAQNSGPTTRTTGAPCPPGSPAASMDAQCAGPHRRHVTRSKAADRPPVRRSHMARIKGVSPAQAGMQVKIAYHFTRRSIAKLTGRETERIIEPLEIYAPLARAVQGLRQARTGDGQAAQSRQAAARARRAEGSHPHPLRILHRYGLRDRPPVGSDRRRAPGPAQLSGKPAVLRTGQARP